MREVSAAHGITPTSVLYLECSNPLSVEKVLLDSYSLAVMDEFDGYTEFRHIPDICSAIALAYKVQKIT